MSDVANTEEQEHWANEGVTWVEQQQQYDAMLRPLGAIAMEYLALQPGERVLDIGCGCGDTTLALGDIVGSTGAVLGADISVPMLRRAIERGESVRNVSFIEADAQIHDFDDLIVDAVFSRFGVMFFEDPGAGFANIVSPLRPGGRATFLVWQGLDRNEWMFVPGGALVGAGIELPIGDDPRAPGVFQLSDGEWAGSLLTDAGLTDVEVEPIETTMLIGGGLDAEGSMAFLRDSGIGQAILAGADEDVVARALDAATEAVRPYETDEGVRIGAAMWRLSGHKPH